MSVDAGFAQWLRDRAIFAAVTEAAIVATWGALATESEIVSPLATEAGALAEGLRQIAMLGGPLVIDAAVVPGLRADLFGRAIDLRCAQLGYAAGRPVFVIGVEESATAELTTLTVVRKL